MSKSIEKILDMIFEAVRFGDDGKELHSVFCHIATLASLGQKLTRRKEGGRD
jgi:hypothetical protein